MTNTAGLVAEVRAFNRFYTGVIGVLRERMLQSPWSLTEARVLYELAQTEHAEVAGLRQRLDLDAGYLSRILGRFEADGLATRERSSSDGRRQVIRLTAAGREAFAQIDARSAAEVEALLGGLADRDRRRLAGAMAAIRSLLGGSPPERGALVLRPPEPGDHGWVVQRHGALYAREYGWDERFEALVARIVADYVDGHDPQRERAWIAEVDGEPVGCVFCVQREPAVAQLRLLLVEPGARGMGVGARLVEECVRFARRAGYERIVLWTNDVLTSARRIYEAAGFRLVASEPHHSYGQDLVGQTWELVLAGPPE